MHHIKFTFVRLKPFSKVQVLLLFSSVVHGVPGEVIAFGVVLCLCMSSNCLLCLSAYATVFITSHGTTGACVVGGVLVLLLSRMSRFFSNLPLILFSAPLREGWYSCQHSKTISFEDTHTFAAGYKDAKVNMKVWPHTITPRHTQRSQLRYRCDHLKDVKNHNLSNSTKILERRWRFQISFWVSYHTYFKNYNQWKSLAL